MMVAIAKSAAADGFDIVGATATRAPSMIVSAEALEAAAPEVEEIARAHANFCDGIIVAAFGDPGLAGIKSAMNLPAVGIGESSMLDAAENGRRFGVATTTPLLKAKIDALPKALGLRSRYTGTRFAEGDPQQLMHDPTIHRSYVPPSPAWSKHVLRWTAQRPSSSAVVRWAKPRASFSRCLRCRSSHRSPLPSRGLFASSRNAPAIDIPGRGTGHSGGLPCP